MGDRRGKVSRPRHDARVWAAQFLFQREFNRGDMDEALAEFWREVEPLEKARVFTEELILGVVSMQDDLDARLQSYAEHWDLKRMGLVDRNVLRVALYEMLCRPDIPPVVSINEAVEVAKELSSRESGRFVNGLLDKICADLDRPARTAQPGPLPVAGEAPRQKQGEG